MLFAELEILRRVIIGKPRPGAAYYGRPAAA
jgi:hypothetical protein